MQKVFSFDLQLAISEKSKWLIILKFFGLIFLTIIANYFVPRPFAVLWNLALLLLYLLSKDEPFWLAFYLVTVDGFMGFFGLYAVTIKVIPGLPAIELVQFYILFSVIKAINNRIKAYIFYRRYLQILLFYLLFLIIWGQLMGFSGEINDYLRVLKFTLPLLLFYSIPRLLFDIKSYERLFGFIFVVLILALFTQLFTLLTGLSPISAIKLTEEQLSEAGEFRGFYNAVANLLGLFGALFFLANKTKTEFHPYYLILVILSAFSMAFLSATRGWIISFGLIIFIYLIFILRYKTKRLTVLLVALAGLLIVGLSNQKIQQQVSFSYERLTTIKALSEGDITAEGTLSRIEQRSPRVMNKWKENPIFGWGFSDISRNYGDGHVGNQNLLMSAGIIGFTLLNGFLIFFCFKLFTAYKRTPNSFYLKNAIPVFIVFIIGWFIIHSTSGQQFRFGGMPLQIIPQAVFFSFGALIYAKAKEYYYYGKTN